MAHVVELEKPLKDILMKYTDNGQGCVIAIVLAFLIGQHSSNSRELPVERVCWIRTVVRVQTECSCLAKDFIEGLPVANASVDDRLDRCVPRVRQVYRQR